MSQPNTTQPLDIGPALMGAIHDGLIVRDRSGVIRDVNRAFCQMVGLSREELVGQAPPHSFWPADQVALLQANLEEVLRGQRSEHDLQYQRRDGARIDVIVSTSPIGGADGKPCGSLTIAKDITERKRHQRELGQAKEAAEAASRAKDQFLAVLSHELRTPLTPVLLAVQGMSLQSLPPEVAPMIDMIRRNVELEARLIDDLLDLTRISRGKLQLQLERLDVHMVLASAIDICRSQVHEKHQRLHVDLRSRRRFVYADPARLQQVFWNLINNAVKFTPTGGDIFLRTFDEEDRLVIQVADSGIGIEPQLLPRIFDAFEQAEGPQTRRFGGLGLGLAICRSLVRMHWGQISAQSGGRGQGATFTLRLPGLEGADEETDAPSASVTGEVRRGTVAAAGAATGAGTAAGARQRILLVDDHDDTRLALKKMLEQAGYVVWTAGTVESALRIAAAEPPEILISDIGLPDGSGLDIMQHVRAKAPQLRGIALSGFGMDEDVRRSRAAGFDHHLTKPISFHRLRLLLKQMSEPAALPVALSPGAMRPADPTPGAPEAPGSGGRGSSGGGIEMAAGVPPAGPARGEGFGLGR